MLRLFTTLSIAILLSIGHVQAEEIVENNLPLFVTITAKWCTSCQSLKPIVEELVPIVGVFCGAKDTAIKEFQAQTEKGIYQAYLDNLVINGTQICSLK
ncbi:MAG: thioredoxin family protein [Candidatus Melainabacteria bacterium]|nr:thioredoxin family protein [Candidatus Melainabacteria bacterium]